MIVFIFIFVIVVNLILKSELDSYVFLKNKVTINQTNFEIHKAYVNGHWDKAKLDDIGTKLLKNGIALEVLDKNNKIIWSISKELSKTDNFKYNIKKKHINYINILKNENIAKERFPIYSDEEELIGYKVFVYDKDIFYLTHDIEFLNKINKTLIILTIVSIMSILAIALLVAKNIANPINKVSNITKFMKKGEYRYLNYDGNIEEVKDLILSINNLSEALQNQENIRKRLITDISHELKTPLTSMHGHLQAIIDGIWDPTTERLMSIDKELMRIVTLIDQLKNLNKLEHEPISKGNVDLEEMILTVVCNYQATALKKNVSLYTELECITAYVDEFKLYQVINNIISNAIKYNTIGGMVNIKLYEDEYNIYINVKDSGIGISEDDIDYIFERFYRADKSRSRSNEGLGIGLTISNMIIREHGGEIIVNTKLNEGSEFVVRIPK
ncbi:MAG: sensor histidine kinase [Peptostreptococcaceae bacterium]